MTTIENQTNESKVPDEEKVIGTKRISAQTAQIEAKSENARSADSRVLKSDRNKSTPSPRNSKKRKTAVEKKSDSPRVKGKVTKNKAAESPKHLESPCNADDLDRIAHYINRIAEGDLSVHIELNTENSSVKKVHAALTNLISSNLTFAHTMHDASVGKLETVEEFNSLEKGQGKQSEIDQDALALTNLVNEFEEKSAAANQIAIGNFEVEISPRSNDDTLGHALVTLQFQIENLLSALSHLSKQTEAGQIHERVKLNDFDGNWTDIAGSVNLILDTLVGHIDSMPLPVFLIGKDYKMLYVNDEARRLTAVYKSSVAGISCSDLFKDSECESIECICSNVTDSGTSETGEIDIQLGDSTNTYKVIAWPLRNRKGEIIGTMQLLMDETAHRTVQNQVFDITQKIDQIVQQLSTSASEAEHQAVAIEQKATSVTDFSHRFNKQVQLISESTESSQSNMSSVSTASEEMAATVGEIAQNAERARSVTSNAVNAVDDASGEVTQLEQAAVQISNVTETIVEIAEQTKLLALNATIEAARAGEAGKGFAVVAGEVKELAQQTNSATSDIRSKIDAIQMATKNTIEKIHNIAAVMNEVNEFVSTIATATEEQAITTRDITETLSRSTSELSSVGTAVTELSELAEKMTRISEDVTHDTKDIKVTSGKLGQIARDLEQTESILVNAIRDLN